VPEPKRHRWNDGFEWENHIGPFDVLSDEQVRHYDELGFIVLEEVFDADELEPVVEELDAREAIVDEFLGAIDGQRFSIAERGAITFAPNLVRDSDVLAEFSRHRAFTALCADLIGPDANLYWDQAVYKKPDKPRRFPWHQDNGYTFVEPQDYLTCWVALTDATPDNGCPHVAPGLHRMGTLAHTWVEPLGWEVFDEPPVESMVAPVPAGGVVVFSSLTPHMTGPNVTDSVRKSYILQYAPAGATRLDGDPGATPTRRTVDDAQIQYPVLRAGRRC
jgi:ectoine hydroxylase-related dioxygenase (phytanoyl-CoA dioxygenase family)